MFTNLANELGHHLAAKTSAVDRAGTKAWGFTQYGVPEIWYGTEWLGGEDPTIMTISLRPLEQPLTSVGKYTPET